VLQTLADPAEVAGHSDYVTLFMIGAAAWIFGGTAALVLLGVEAPRGALERHNPASLAALVGGALGVTLAYAGSNIGAGPTIWTTLLPAFVATVTLLALGGVLELLTDTADAISIDRDDATGLRPGAVLAANGAILGRAMAGDWHDWPETFTTFARLAWPAVVLTLGVAVLNRALKPTPQRPRPPVATFGVAASAVIIVVGATYVAALGKPDVARPEPGPSPSKVSGAAPEVER
jgi:hypothetical protein